MPKSKLKDTFERMVHQIMRTQVGVHDASQPAGTKYGLDYGVEDDLTLTISIKGATKKARVVLTSMNHSVVSLPPKAAALAIAMVAMNWASWAGWEAGDHQTGREASKRFYQLQREIYDSRKLTKAEKVAVAQYAD